MVYSIGLTGSIASGKTAVAEIFSRLGIETISADQLSRELSAKNQEAYAKIVTHFGTDILNNDEELNRKKLRDIIFTRPEERKWLEKLLHPLIRQKIEERVLACKLPYCVVEIPLLISKKDYPYLNKILLINTSTETQIPRVMQRDHCTKEQALAIIAAQPDINRRLSQADDVVMNDLGFNELEEKIHDLHQKYLQESNYLK